MTALTGGALLALALLLGGCTPEPAPQPTPTPPFTSEEEAFAAAEATYRAYVDALNQVDLSDPATFEPVFAWTTGKANAGARETFSEMHAEQWQVDGPTVVAKVVPTADGWAENFVQLDVCLDVSSVTLVDRDGNSVVAPDRSDVQAMRVTTEPAKTPTGMAISDIDGREDGPSCDE